MSCHRVNRGSIIRSDFCVFFENHCEKGRYFNVYTLMIAELTLGSMLIFCFDKKYIKMHLI